MPEGLKRISLVIREDQHDKLHDIGVNISGFVRDLIDDHFSDHTITLGVSKQTRDLYVKIISNTGADDQMLEGYFREALEHMLKDKIDQMNELQKILTTKTTNPSS